MRFLQMAQTARGAARLRRTGLRYVVLLSSEREKTEGGGIFCAGGFGAGGCFGVMWGESKARLIAAVSDLQRGVIETSATAATAGTSSRHSSSQFLCGGIPRRRLALSWGIQFGLISISSGDERTGNVHWITS